MNCPFTKGALTIGLLLALTIRQVVGNNCLGAIVDTQTDGIVSISYVTCLGCASNKFRYKNGTIILPLSGPTDIYDCGTCNLNCTSCAGSSNNCLTCINFHYLAADNTCPTCTSLVSNCENCTIDGCTRCITNYRPYNNLCIFDCVPIFGTACLTCSAFLCLTCESGYVTDLASPVSACVICSSLPNCQTCVNGPKCSTCQPNFYLDIPNGNISCVTCSIADCQTCTDGPKCALCQPDYHLVYPNN